MLVASTAPAFEPPRPVLRHAAPPDLTGVARLVEAGPVAAPQPPAVPMPRLLPTSRSDRRRLQQEHAHARRRRQQVWRAWWFWPLVVLAVGCLWLAMASASVSAPDRPVVVPSTAPVGS